MRGFGRAAGPIAGTLLLALCLSHAKETEKFASGPYVAVERKDSKRILMRVPSGADMPDVDDEVMLEQLAQWKWRVEMAAVGAVMLVTSSNCPHGLGLLPEALGWHGGGYWQEWRGTFEHVKGSLTTVQRQQAWTVISSSKACEGAAGIRSVGKAVGVTEKKCLTNCEARADCQAVDYYRNTKWCLYYDKPCTNPRLEHDGASSWRFNSGAKEGKAKDVIGDGLFTFQEAKDWCLQVAECGGFSFEGTWPDKEREGGVPRSVVFSSMTRAQTAGDGNKWQSYLLKDDPRAYCNPEGAGFECPQNPYACLGLSIDADENAVKQAYRAMSKRMHPDKIAASKRTPEEVKKAEEGFRHISEAHEILRDMKRRREADMSLKKARKEWEEKRVSVQDIYIKEPLVISLEPESYPVLLPKGQEWLVHFFMPTNDDCKQMKIAIARAAAELGTGGEERDEVTQQKAAKSHPSFEEGEVYRGTMREGSDALRLEGAASREGDTFVAMVILLKAADGASAVFHTPGESFNVQLELFQNKDRKQAYRIVGPERILTGTFDSNPSTFRGTVVDKPQPDKEVASFTLTRDTWRQPDGSQKRSDKGRQLPRLFGAVNCGRFGDFCKRKGINPEKTRFPQVRILFPEESRFEIYKGRPLAKDFVAFAREASRPQGPVTRLDATAMEEIQSSPRRPWLMLFMQGDGKRECELCKAALPMLRRTATRLEAAGVGAGWANCSEDAICGQLGQRELDAEWGSLRWAELGGSVPTANARLTSLWESSLVPGADVNQQWLLAAMEAASRTADFFEARQAGDRAGSATKERVDL